jgi:hypothetical protein
LLHHTAVFFPAGVYPSWLIRIQLLTDCAALSSWTTENNTTSSMNFIAEFTDVRGKAINRPATTRETGTPDQYLNWYNLAALNHRL